MAEIDIDPFSDHDKMDAQPDETVKLSLSAQEEEDLLVNQNKKHCLVEQASGRKFSENMLKGCIKRYLNAWVKPWKDSILMISNSEMGTVLQRQGHAFND